MNKAEAEWRAIFTKVAIKAAALASYSTTPLVCRMQLEMNHLHYCDDCHRCGIECMPPSYGAYCCPVSGSEPTYTEYRGYEELSKKVKAAEERVSKARVMQDGSSYICRLGIGNTSEASVAAALDNQRLKNAESDLKKIETERSIWVSKCSDSFKNDIKTKQKAEAARIAADEYEMEQSRIDMRDM